MLACLQGIGPRHLHCGQRGLLRYESVPPATNTPTQDAAQGATMNAHAKATRTPPISMSLAMAINRKRTTDMADEGDKGTLLVGAASTFSRTGTTSKIGNRGATGGGLLWASKTVIALSASSASTRDWRREATSSLRDCFASANSSSLSHAINNAPANTPSINKAIARPIATPVSNPRSLRAAIESKKTPVDTTRQATMRSAVPLPRCKTSASFLADCRKEMDHRTNVWNRIDALKRLVSACPFMDETQRRKNHRGHRWWI